MSTKSEAVARGKSGGKTDDKPVGIVLHGIIKGRRIVTVEGKDGKPDRFKIVYGVRCGEVDVELSDWVEGDKRQALAQALGIGEEIDQQVIVTTWMARGRPMYALQIPREREFGETF